MSDKRKRKHPQSRKFSSRDAAIDAAEEFGWQSPDDDLTVWFGRGGEYKLVETTPYSDWQFVFQYHDWREPHEDEIFETTS